MIEAWKKLETVVVLDHQWTASCRFADIVLPVTTRFERNDIEQFGTHSNKGLMALHQVVKPQYEARHDFDVFAGLCKRFDKESVYRENRDEMQWVQALYDEGVKMGASLGVTLPDFDTFWKGEGYVEYPAGQPWVRHGEFRDQPDLNPLGTPSGLIEIYSKTIAGFQYDDCPDIRCGWSRLNVAIRVGKINIHCTCNPVIRINACTPSCAQVMRFAARMR